jgi:putative membrane protein
MSALMLQWSFEPTTAVPLGLTALWYLLGLARVSRRLTLRRFATKSQLCAFASGLLALVIALFSPIDAVAEQLFSAHMVQHLLLLVVAAPLLAWSRPSLVFLWAFPARGRKAIARAWGTLRMRRATNGIMHPMAVWLLFSGNFVFWHCPAPYRWAFQSEGVHAFEHLSFLVSALLFWTIVFAPEGHRRLGYGGTLIFVTTTAVVSGLPGALMLLAPIPLYPVHAEGVTAWHLTLLQDQLLAGLIMWIPAGLVYLAAACFAFIKWLAEPEPMLVSRVPYLLALVLAPQHCCFADATIIAAKPSLLLLEILGTALG